MQYIHVIHYYLMQNKFLRVKGSSGSGNILDQQIQSTGTSKVQCSFPHCLCSFPTDCTADCCGKPLAAVVSLRGGRVVVEV